MDLSWVFLSMILFCLICLFIFQSLFISNLIFEFGSIGWFSWFGASKFLWHVMLLLWFLRRMLFVVMGNFILVPWCHDWWNFLLHYLGLGGNVFWRIFWLLVICWPSCFELLLALGWVESHGVLLIPIFILILSLPFLFLARLDKVKILFETLIVADSLFSFMAIRIIMVWKSSIFMVRCWNNSDWWSYSLNPYFLPWFLLGSMSLGWFDIFSNFFLHLPYLIISHNFTMEFSLDRLFDKWDCYCVVFGRIGHIYFLSNNDLLDNISFSLCCNVRLVVLEIMCWRYGLTATLGLSFCLTFCHFNMYIIYLISIICWILSWHLWSDNISLCLVGLCCCFQSASLFWFRNLIISAVLCSCQLDRLFYFVAQAFLALGSRSVNNKFFSVLGNCIFGSRILALTSPLWHCNFISLLSCRVDCFGHLGMAFGPNGYFSLVIFVGWACSSQPWFIDPCQENGFIWSNILFLSYLFFLHFLLLSIFLNVLIIWCNYFLGNIYDGDNIFLSLYCFIWFPLLLVQDWQYSSTARNICNMNLGSVPSLSISSLVLGTCLCWILEWPLRHLCSDLIFLWNGIGYCCPLSDFWQWTVPGLKVNMCTFCCRPWISLSLGYSYFCERLHFMSIHLLVTFYLDYWFVLWLISLLAIFFVSLISRPLYGAFWNEFPVILNPRHWQFWYWFSLAKLALFLALQCLIFLLSAGFLNATLGRLDELLKMLLMPLQCGLFNTLLCIFFFLITLRVVGARMEKFLGFSILSRSDCVLCTWGWFKLRCVSCIRVL